MQFVSPKEIRNNYPLYWLAPTADQKIRRISTESLLRSAQKHGGKNNVIKYPAITGIYKKLLPLIGLAPWKKDSAAIRIARLKDSVFIEKGALKLKLAFLLKLECVTVNIREYDYISLTGRMHIQRKKDIDMAGVARIDGTGHDYYGISPAHAEVLIRNHRVTLTEQALPAAQLSTNGTGQKNYNREQGFLSFPEKNKIGEVRKCRKHL